MSEALTDTERAVAEIWSEDLSVSAIDPSSDFFALGGDSLNMLTILFKVSQTFGVEIGPEILYRSPTLKVFSSEIEEVVGSASEASTISTGTL